MAVRILPRSTWTSTSPGGSPINWSRVRGLVAHYPAMGGDVGVISQSREIHYLQGWRNYHVYSLGWSDIGYCYAIGQSGRIYKLRGDRNGGHTYGHNSTTLGVLFIVGNNEPLTPAAKSAFRSLRALLRQRGASSGVWGHTEMSGNSTRCPGPYIMGSIRSGELSGASAPSRPSVPGLSDGLAHVDDSQRWLNELGYDAGSVDGIFGPKTEAATRAFQRQFDITPADGRPGPATRSILEEAVSVLDEVLAIVTQNQVEIRQTPDRILDKPIALAGMHEGMTSTARTKLAWQGHNFTKTHQDIAATQSAVVTAVQKAGQAQGLTDEAVQAIASAAAEAAAQVSAEDVAEHLEVGVKGD